MTRADDLKRRLEAYDLSIPEAARRLLVHRTTVWRWTVGDLPIEDRSYDHIKIKFPVEEELA